MSTAVASKRIIYIDLLRIISILAVIILHITATLVTRTNDFSTTSWWVGNVLNSVCRFAVPVFFMISGAMILRTEVKSIADFYKKRILPLVVPLFAWSLIYGLYYQYVILKTRMGAWEFVLDFGYKLLTDRNYIHLWFLYAIIAIYMTVPLISKFVKLCSEKDLRYYLLLWFIVSIVYLLVSELILRITGKEIHIPSLYIPFFLGYLGYFILGYYLFHFDLKPVFKHILFNAGIASFFLTPLLTYFVSTQKGSLDEMFYGNYSITSFFMAVALFLYFKEKDASISRRINDKIRIIIVSVSAASFSIYLIHLLVEMLIAKEISVDASFLRTSASLFYNVITVFLISLVVVKVLNLNRWITQLLFGGRG
ncbi:acyltransferase [Paenibacillus sp. L3-i20]|uniref:acyltransferase n=1 Tax=Paenibacillus sp. L3-i20 TaxID=2905833 RepID=UPI001EDF9429|nr:acyltransferase family protein [Paenibacillus sp. L3-i20]GKU77949.1 membrane protein [Paenibacillus sp. L3-i20]